MKRLYLAAFAGLCTVGSLRAQDGYLAPTAPVVPPPVLHNGSLVAPAGVGGGGLFTRNNWSPVRSPVMPSDAMYTGQVPCGPAGCGPHRSCLERLKAWLCFQHTPTELPKFRPTPYITPLQGMFGCSSGAGCAPCATGGYPAPVHGAPALPPAPIQMPAPMKPPVSAGAVLMPSRGTPGAPAPTTWSGATEFGTVKSTANQSWQKPAQNPVVPTGYRAPQK